MLSLRYHVGPKILEVNIKNPQIIHVLVVLGQNAKVVGSIKVSRGGIDFFPSEKGRRLVFATSNKSKGEEGKEEGLDKIKTDWGRVEIITRIICFSNTRSQGHKRLGQTKREHYLGAKVKSS